MNCHQLLEANMVLHGIYAVPSPALFDFSFMCIVGAPSFYILLIISHSRVPALFEVDA